MDENKIPYFEERHKATGRVTAGDFESGPHASVYVCDRAECIAEASRWAENLVHLEPRHVRFGKD